MKNIVNNKLFAYERRNYNLKDKFVIYCMFKFMNIEFVN